MNKRQLYYQCRTPGCNVVVSRRNAYCWRCRQQREQEQAQLHHDAGNVCAACPWLRRCERWVNGYNHSLRRPTPLPCMPESSQHQAWLERSNRGVGRRAVVDAAIVQEGPG